MGGNGGGPFSLFHSDISIGCQDTKRVEKFLSVCLRDSERS